MKVPNGMGRFDFFAGGYTDQRGNASSAVVIDTYDERESFRGSLFLSRSMLAKLSPFLRFALSEGEFVQPVKEALLATLETHDNRGTTQRERDLTMRNQAAASFDAENAQRLLAEQAEKHRAEVAALRSDVASLSAKQSADLAAILAHLNASKQTQTQTQ
jgi:hypothetical protein